MNHVIDGGPDLPRERAFLGIMYPTLLEQWTRPVTPVFARSRGGEAGEAMQSHASITVATC